MGLWYIYYELVAMGLQSRYSKDKSTISINYTETIPIVHGDCKPTHTTFVDTSIWLVTTHFQGTGQDGTALLRVRSTAWRLGRDVAAISRFKGQQILVYFTEHAHKKWMIWGYPYFRKPQKMDSTINTWWSMWNFSIKGVKHWNLIIENACLG